MSTPGTIPLFCYGTLLVPDVQRQLFGRTVEPVVDALPDHAMGWLPITDPDVLAISGSSSHPGAYPERGVRIEGGVLWLTESELDRVAAYEVSDYARSEVVLKSGLRALIYLKGGTDVCRKI